MEYYEVQHTVERVLDGHRKGYSDIQQAANLLENFWYQLTDDSQKDMTAVMWAFLASEPLRQLPPAESVSPNIHRVIIRAVSKFGPTAELPARVFGLLRWNEPDTMEFWARHLCGELSYSMYHNARRFSKATLDQAKSYSATYTYTQHCQSIGGAPPQRLVDAVSNLGATIDRMEYERFAAEIEGPQQESADKPWRGATSLTASGVPTAVALAMGRAMKDLESSDPFDAKAAADLIRTSMDEAHRAVISELEGMTGRKCERPEKDGPRREYMRDVGFISRPEETFFSAIYKLLSEEAVHKILAPKETVLVMEVTVRNYLLLLFRRLSARRLSAPEGPR